jgi:hypothetical protein
MQCHAEPEFNNELAPWHAVVANECHKTSEFISSFTDIERTLNDNPCINKGELDYTCRLLEQCTLSALRRSCDQGTK